MSGKQIRLFLALMCIGTPSTTWAFRTGPPAAENGSTASGGGTCRACHGDAVGVGSVQILGVPAIYSPNVVYEISVRVADPNQQGAGFQISVEDAAGNHRGTLIVSDPVNTKFNEFDNNWVNHTFAGVGNAVANWVADGDSATYNLRWQAPAADEGALTFWAAGNAINDDFTFFGDIIYLTNATSLGECVPDCVCAPPGAPDGCGGTCPGVECDDGNPCNGEESCDPSTGCVAGSPLVCNDGNVCNGLETCNPASGCVPGSPPVCDDGLFCTGTETCVPPTTGCVSSGNPCPDGTTCNEDTQACEGGEIPTVSEWGLVVLALLLLTGAKLRFAQRLPEAHS